MVVSIKSFTNARTHLAKILSHRRDLLAKHESIIVLIKFSDPPTKDISFIPTSSDKYYQSVVDKSRTYYNRFVDDSLFVAVDPSIRHAIPASIEALSIILGFSVLAARQNSLSLDKYYQSVCSYQCIQLGKLVNSRTMAFHITEPKRLFMIQEFVHWRDSRRAFTLLQSVTLCDNSKIKQVLARGVVFFSCSYVTLSR